MWGVRVSIRPEQPEPFLRGCVFPAVTDAPYPRPIRPGPTTCRPTSGTPPSCRSGSASRWSGPPGRSGSGTRRREPASGTGGSRPVAPSWPTAAARRWRWRTPSWARGWPSWPSPGRPELPVTVYIPEGMQPLDHRRGRSRGHHGPGAAPAPVAGLRRRRHPGMAGLGAGHGVAGRRRSEARSRRLQSRLRRDGPGRDDVGADAGRDPGRGGLDRFRTEQLEPRSPHDRADGRRGPLFSLRRPRRSSRDPDRGGEPDGATRRRGLAQPGRRHPRRTATGHGGDRPRPDAADDEMLFLVDGRSVVDPEDLEDGIYPGDEGHRRLAAAVSKILVPHLADLQTAAEKRWASKGTSPTSDFAPPVCRRRTSRRRSAELRSPRDRVARPDGIRRRAPRRPRHRTAHLRRCIRERCSCERCICGRRVRRSRTGRHRTGRHRNGRHRTGRHRAERRISRRFVIDDDATGPGEPTTEVTKHAGRGTEPVDVDVADMVAAALAVAANGATGPRPSRRAGELQWGDPGPTGDTPVGGPTERPANSRGGPRSDRRTHSGATGRTDRRTPVGRPRDAYRRHCAGPGGARSGADRRTAAERPRGGRRVAAAATPAGPRICNGWTPVRPMNGQWRGPPVTAR